MNLFGTGFAPVAPLNFWPFNWGETRTLRGEEGFLSAWPGFLSLRELTETSENSNLIKGKECVKKRIA